MVQIHKEIDARYLRSPNSMLMTLRAMDELEDGQVLKITTTEGACLNNLEAFCKETGNSMIETIDWGGEVTCLIRKHGTIAA